MSNDRIPAANMTIPRPDQTTFALMLLIDSTPEEARRFALEDLVDEVTKKWVPGNDLIVIVRQPTQSELALRMADADPADDGDAK